MQTVRVFFSKTGRAKYISHLDLVRCLARAFARTDIPAWFTEGFNPHLYLTFSLPLPLGVSGLEESMDFRLTDDAYPLSRVESELRRVLPEGLEALWATPAADNPMEIAWADYGIGLFSPAPRTLCAQLRDFFGREQILTIKKTKRGEKEIDLAPLLRVLSLSAETDRVRLCLRLAAGNTLNIGPTLALGAFWEAVGETSDYQTVERIRILKADFTPFR